MDRQSSIDARTRPLRHSALAGELVPALIAILLALQCGIALLLIVRRAQGAITLTSSPGWLILWMLLAALLAAVTRGSGSGTYGHATGAVARAAWYAPLVDRYCSWREPHDAADVSFRWHCAVGHRADRGR